MKIDLTGIQPAKQYTNQGSIKLQGGEIYEGSLVDGVPQGKGIMTYPDGSIYKGEFKAGEPYGYVEI